MENYKLHQRLGKGAQGAVFLVEDKHDNSKYVLKKVECNDESEANKAFKEAMALQELRHPFVCGYKEFFVTWDKEEAAMFVCIVMEYYKLGDLSKALKQKRVHKQSVDEIIVKKWFGQMIEALKFVHNKQVIHRDLKPSNIFLADSGNISIGDFGVATIMDDARTRTRTTVGTMNWMAPEVLERPYDERSDIWSLGCILLEMVTCGFMDVSEISSALFQIKQSPQFLEEILETVGKEYCNDMCHIIRMMLRRNFQQRPSTEELCELPYVKSCIALASGNTKASAGAPKSKTQATKKTVKPVPKAKGIAAVLTYMKGNMDNSACQVEALKYLKELTSKDVLMNATAKKAVATTMQSHKAVKQVQLLGCKIFVNLLKDAGEDDIMYTKEIIHPILLAMRSHADPSSSELQKNACALLMAFSADETAAEVIGRLGGVQDVLSALRAFSNNADIVSNCCNALWGLSVNEKNCKIVTEERGLQDICSALVNHFDVVQLVEAASSAIWSLSMEEENIEAMSDLEIVQLLMEAMEKHKTEAKVAKNACMALASIVEANETCAFQLLHYNDYTGLKLLVSVYNNLKENEEVAENVCLLFSELVEYEEIRDWMKKMKEITEALVEAKGRFSSNEDLVTVAASGLALLGGGSRSGRRNSSARSRPRSAAAKK